MLDLIRGNAVAEIRRIAAFCGGSVGVAARHLESGAVLESDGAGRYPMASTIKMNLALTILDLAERGVLSLDDMIAVRPEEMTPLGPLGGAFLHSGVALSVRNLLEITITHSDNTATDVLFRLAGGPPGVMAFLHRVGLVDIEVARTMREALCVMHEIDLPPPHISMRDALQSLSPTQIQARSRPSAEGADYGHARRDHATPLAMLALLTRLWHAEIASPAGRDLLLGMMSRTTTGATRLRARLPAGVAVANKTGSGTGTANDLGYVTLPQGRGTMAMVIYIKGSPQDGAARDTVLADIARIVFDSFLLTSTPSA
jgi:beta-lactamase class A